MLLEDGQVVEIQVSAHDDLRTLRCWHGRSQREHVVNNHVFPPGTRILHNLPSNQGEEVGDGSQRTVCIGIPMTPLEAVRRAKLLEHPFDSSFQMPDHVLDGVYQVITKGTEAIHEERSGG